MSKNGYRLPTEAEWEYAARGGLEGKRYPWGNTISLTDANYTANMDDIRETKSVASYMPNEFGLFDMIGNAAEWVNDTFCETYYAETDGATDPEGPSIDKYLANVIRGGSFFSISPYCRTAYRGYDENTVFTKFCYFDVGFRVVRHIPAE